MKKVVSILLAGLFAVCLFASCTNKGENLSSTLVSSEVAQIEEVSSEAAQSEHSSSEDKKNSSTITTTSTPKNDQTSSNNKPLFDRNPTSSSESQSVKYYNKGTVGLGAYQFRIDLCTAAGSDYESKLEEFADVVEEGYFNTYFLTLDEKILDQMKLVAESGGTVWLAGNRYDDKSSIDTILDNIEFYLDFLDKHGYKDLVNGFYWYEPLWEGTMSNSEFLTLTKALYQKFGLRNFPTFAPRDFDLTGNETQAEADAVSKVLPSTLKYVTDISFTAYGVDVRDGVKPSADTLNRWQSTISPDIKTSGDYYIGYKEKLQAYTGHAVNTWYYACAYEAPVGTGLGGLSRADEGYCVGHLEFMADDVLKSQYQGGIVIHKYNVSNDRYGFQRHLPVKDSRGKYKYYPSEEKWENYGQALKKVKAKFDSQKANTAKI